MIYTDAEYLRAYVREVVEPPGYTTTAKRLLAIADRLEKIDAERDEAIAALRACELVADRNLNPAAHGQRDVATDWQSIKKRARAILAKHPPKVTP